MSKSTVQAPGALFDRAMSYCGAGKHTQALVVVGVGIVDALRDVALQLEQLRASQAAATGTDDVLPDGWTRQPIVD